MGYVPRGELKGARFRKEPRPFCFPLRHHAKDAKEGLLRTGAGSTPALEDDLSQLGGSFWPEQDLLWAKYLDDPI